MNPAVGIDYALGQLAVVSSQRDVLAQLVFRKPASGLRHEPKQGQDWRESLRWITVPTFRSTIGIPIPKLWLKGLANGLA
jgi:hypothetical protein